MAKAFQLTAAAAGPMSRYGSVEPYELVLGRLLAGIYSGASPTG